MCEEFRTWRIPGKGPSRRMSSFDPPVAQSSPSLFFSLGMHNQTPARTDRTPPKDYNPVIFVSQSGTTGILKEEKRFSNPFPVQSDLSGGGSSNNLITTRRPNSSSSFNFLSSQSHSSIVTSYQSSNQTWRASLWGLVILFRPRILSGNVCLAQSELENDGTVITEHVYVYFYF
jgi:hypothetical protein